jgi:midasin (ATPase involved in ribosome maturation)
VAAWRQELELKKQLEAEEEAAFRTQTVCEDKDEEVELEEEYQRLFPSFQEAFAGLVQSNSLEDSGRAAVQGDDGDTESEGVKKNRPDSSFSPQRLNQLKQLAVFMLDYFSAETAEGVQQAAEEDFLQRAAMVNKVVATLPPGAVSPTLEAGLVPSFIAVAALTIRRHHQSSLSEQKKQEASSPTSATATYNFYLDPNLEEAQLIQPLLASVSLAVSRLLEQFPENPVLAHILQVRDRILLLPVSSPLAKCLTGLELLLAACQEWEKNAHRGVSLQPVMDAASGQILRWRRLELANWRSLLLGQAGLAGLRAQAAESYWLHVMAVVLEAKKKTETVQALVRFVESASLADFQSRLDILVSVRRILVLMSGSGGPTRRWVLACLANLHAYYSRFRPAVDAALAVHLKAAEKKVAEFVRMTRWKDTNFWSVKTMVDKTRKTMHKTLKQFTKAVNVPCTPSLLDSGDAEETSAGLTSLYCPEDSQLIGAAAPAGPPRHLQVILSPKLEPLGTFVKLRSRAFSMSVKIRKQLNGLSLQEDIADLVPTIVRELEGLAALKVDETRSREHKKSQAGHIQQRKRRALNDLFRTLQGLGLSYRYGLVNCAAGLNSSQELLHYLEPGQQPAGWNHLEKYFFRYLSLFYVY